MKSLDANRFIPTKYLALTVILALIGTGAVWLALPAAPAHARPAADTGTIVIVQDVVPGTSPQSISYNTTGL
ncbi:MAG: hypothetical protein O6913_09005, partial [Chloroflexi bacterium]|nr:hypothetical protein [Chloroflexota bacterium]